MTGPAPAVAERAPDYLSTRDIASCYRVHPRTVIRWITTRGLAAVRVGGQWRVDRAVMDDWLTRGRNSSRPA